MSSNDDTVDLDNLMYRLMSRGASVRSFNFWDKRETLTEYPSQLFVEEKIDGDETTKTKRLTRDSVLFFPRDQRRFNDAVASQVSLSRYWDHVLSSLVGRSPVLRSYPIDTFEVDKVLVPLLHVTLSDAIVMSDVPLSRQNIEYESTARRMRLLVSNMDSLYHWAMHYCNSALTIVRLSDSNLQRARQLDETRYSNRVRELKAERVRLDALLRRAEINYEQAMNRYKVAFARELNEREKIVDLLTNYLSGTLFRIRGNVNYIEPRKPVNIDRNDVRRRIESLIPFYRKLRLMLLERSMLQRLVAGLTEYSSVSGNTNPLVKEYF